MAGSDTGEEFTFEKGLRDLARRIEEADGVVPLKPGEIRPLGYYGAGYFSKGLKPLPPPRNRPES